ncbi:MULTISPECIES: Rz1-like lysis system protein LysC [unclassified Serratia (in: enterobacteria)]|uniref:Rz1-like lysis system protein LysC n=1 Tax=unclassified Serratia (in: enterobacteria) TaxID=2647522 RepID=UPI003FA68ECC
MVCNAPLLFQLLNLGPSRAVSLACSIAAWISTAIPSPSTSGALSCNWLATSSYVLPPIALLQKRESSPFEGITFGDAVEALQIKQGEMDICASRIEALTKW